MDDQSKSSPIEFGIEERFGIGIAVASGLVMAACISGLPAMSCTALAEAYAKAVNNFGLTAFGSLLTLASMLLFRPRIARLKRTKTDDRSDRPFLIYGYRVTIYCSLAITTYLFIGSRFAGADNLQAATEYCFFGKDAELALRVAERVKLEGPFSWFPRIVNN